MDTVAFTESDTGCYADGIFGHQHTRAKLAELVEAVDGGLCNPEAMELLEALRAPMPDDAWDEDEAIDFLNSATAEGLEWQFREGDLMLSGEIGR